MWGGHLSKLNGLLFLQNYKQATLITYINYMWVLNEVLTKTFAHWLRTEEPQVTLLVTQQMNSPL